MTVSEKQKKIQINKGIQMDRELRDIIHGYVMSDGHINAGGSLQVRHSIKQRKFVEWLYKHLTVLRTPPPIRTVTRVDPRSNTKFTVCGFQTRNILQGFHSLWYKKSKVGGKIRYIKSLPANLACFFNPTFLSVWFAGDGTQMIGQRGAKFEVTCFTPEERRYLQQLFKQKFDINAKILRSGVRKTGTTQWSLSIPAGEYEKFRNLITQMDLIPTLFPYKLCKKV
uniref:Homing endonuclease LAGLIDADG domain-containing protein n=1 Tax=Johnson-sea-linkia profunda TaxID=575876 RepID=A0A386AXM9_9CHLO|nr:hypothetical protein [Johnson-sea-linkia profunda]